MDDAMVTGRMPTTKKQKGASLLRQEGLSASQAINLMYDRIIEEGDASFLLPEKPAKSNDSKWIAASHFVDSISSERTSRFDNMSKDEIRRERLRSKNLI